MELANQITLIFHLVGVGALLSGFFYQLKDWGKGMTVNAGILHGAWLMFATGMIMAGLIPAIGTEVVNPIPLALKTVGLTLIFFLAYANKKKEVTPKYVVPTIALLTVFNIAVAIIGPIIQSK